MTSINMMGTYSGITMDTIDQLIEAESAKGIQYTNQKSEIETERNAWKDINTRLDSLFNNLETLTKKETFQSKTVNSNVGNSTSLSVSANEHAPVGQYRVQVQKLAISTRITGDTIKIDGETLASIDEPLNQSGTFTFEIDDGTSYDIEITTKDTLRDITAKINVRTEDSGVQASIIDDRLVLTDTNMGDRALKVQVNEVSDKLGFTGVEAEPGQSAEFVVNGVAIERNTNVIDDAVEGITFTLTNVHDGADSEIVTVATNEEKVTQAVQDFVDQYNSVMSFIDEQMDVGDPSVEGNTTGALTGDSALMRLQSGLRSIMTRNLAGNFSGDFNNLEDMGITVDRYGQAILDEVKFSEAFQADPTNVARFFYSPDVTPEEVNQAGEVVSEAQEQEGLSELLRNFIDTYISDSTGVIKTKNETYDRMLEDINDQIDRFNERIEQKRERYIQQFTALDVAMMQAQSQLDYLYSQLGMTSQN